MDFLNWELHVLSRAVAYSHLTLASSHVGMSQPQLSRVIQKLEREFQIALLDRESKRKSSWTKAAFQLAEIYLKTFKEFHSSSLRLSAGLEMQQIRVGTLEGLATTAMAFAQSCFKAQDLNGVEIDVHDLHELEEIFLKKGFDFVLTSKEPGKRKLPYIKVLGSQSLVHQNRGTKGSYRILSSYQFLDHPKNKGQTERLVISNSLEVRKKWLELYGGEGVFPSEIQKKGVGALASQTVLLIGNVDLPKTYWQKITKLDF